MGTENDPKDTNVDIQQGQNDHQSLDDHAGQQSGANADLNATEHTNPNSHDGDNTLTGGSDNDSLASELNDDILKGGDGDDVLSGSDGKDKLYGNDGDDTFLFGADEGNSNTFEGGSGSWADIIQLDNVNQGPTSSIQNDESWVLTVGKDVSYTIDNDNQSLTFTDGDASGSITLNDDSKVDFTHIYNMEW